MFCLAILISYFHSIVRTVIQYHRVENIVFRELLVEYDNIVFASTVLEQYCCRTVLVLIAKFYINIVYS